jgi:hypothetical protein
MKDIKLKKGQVIKNHKELCRILGVKYSENPDSRKAHIKEFERYCIYHKDGHKYIIDDVFDIPKPKIDKRTNNGGNNTKYDTLMDDVVIDYLAIYMNYEFTLLDFLEYSGITTRNFRILYFTDYKQYAEDKKINKGLVQTYKLKSKTIMKNCLEVSLNRLKKQNLLTYKETYLYINKRNKSEIANDNMIKKIKEAENKALSELDITHFDRVFKNNNAIFKSLVMGKLNEDNIKIKRYWKVYSVFPTQELKPRKTNKMELIKRIKKSINKCIVDTKINKKQKQEDWGIIHDIKPYSTPWHIEDIKKLNKEMFKKI